MIEVEIREQFHDGGQSVRAVNRSTNRILFEAFLSEEVERIVVTIDKFGPQFSVERPRWEP